MVFEGFKEPTGNKGEYKKYNRAKDDGGHNKADPEGRADFTPCHAGNGSQHQQGQDIGDDGAANGKGNRADAGKAKLTGYGVSQQGVRGKHTGQQDGRGKGKAKDIISSQPTQHHGDGKGKQAKYKAFNAVLFKLLQVDLQACREHNI